MTRFFDASALLKPLFKEKEYREVELWLQESTPVMATHSYAEVGATLGRALREGKIDDFIYHKRLNRFVRFWRNRTVVPYDVLVTMHARSLYPLYGLRAGDVIQLASAVVTGYFVRDPVEVVTYDKKLWEAAQIHGFTCLPHDLLQR